MKHLVETNLQHVAFAKHEIHYVLTHPPIRLAESSAKVINVFEMSKWWGIFLGACVFAFSVILGGGQMIMFF